MQNLKEVFKELYTEWFSNKHFWFSKNLEIDRYLSEKYFNCIKDITSYSNELQDQDIAVLIGSIIAFDQIPRHHNRIENVDCFNYSNIASNISIELIVILSTNENLYNSIKAYEWCFIMLPHRHVNDKSKIITIIQFFIEKYIKNGVSQEDKAIYKKYLFNTINRYYKINTKDIINNNQPYCEKSLNEYYQWETYNSILENNPIFPISNIIEDIYLTNVFNNEKKTITGNENIIVSLSGGVDSCVCLYLMKHFFPHNNITAVHINYNNKEECNDELQFVLNYCSKLNVPCYHRTIDEISRNHCHHNGLRSLYEDVTKNIRFDTYKQVEKKFKNNEKTLVVLGHNKDDCFENIITNISLKNHYSNLSGISKLCVIDEINFWRPLIDVRKKDIINFALDVNIPFLKNSTPSWSARGKIRDVILPSLMNINSDILNSFFVLKDYIASSDNIINKYVIDSIITKFELSNDKKSLKCEFIIDEVISNLNIWIKIFNNPTIINFMNGNHISFKSINCFVEFLDRFKQKFDKLQYNVEKKHLLTNDLLCILYKKKNNNVEMIFIKT